MAGGIDPSQSLGGLPRSIDLIGSPVVGGGSVLCSITIDAVPPAGATIQVGVDHPGIVSSPGGSWPYLLAYASPGGTTASFTITTVAVSSDTQVQIYACESGVDIGQPGNWRTVAVLNVTVR